MGAATRDFRSMIALVLRGSVEGSQMTVVATAERTTIDWCTPEGTVATFTARKRPAPVAVSRQLGLPGVVVEAAPVAVVDPPAPLPSALVELVAITSWEPTPPVEAIDDGRAVLWTGVTDEGSWRTVVPAAVADTLQAFAPGCFERRSPTAPSHLLRVGSLVMTPGGERAVLGLVASDDEGSSCGAVLDIAGQPQVAWLDGAAIRDGRVMLYPTDRYRGVPGDDGWWVAKHHAAPVPVAAPVEDDDGPTLYRLWLPARAFGELTDAGRELYDHPDVGVDLTWEPRGEYVTAADVTESVARIVLDLAREDGFALHVGPRSPVVALARQREMDAAPKKSASKRKDPKKAPPVVSRWVLEADWQAMPAAEQAHLYASANHRASGSLYRELGPMPLPVAIDLDADAEGIVTLLSERPVEAPAEAPKPAPPKKSAPGSKAKPHRLTPMPEADALAQQGALVAVALQPDGHWKLWASNPEKPGGALMTSPVWKKRWDGARRADLRVRLYNRARRCTHDSLDGDIGEEASQ